MRDVLNFPPTMLHGISCRCRRMGPSARALGSVLPQLRGTRICFKSAPRKIAERYFTRRELRQPPLVLRLRFFPESGKRRERMTVFRCEKNSGNPEESSEDEDKPTFLTADFWVQVAIFLFAAGFVDAGFSGDWSRIGVLTKETEGELQMAAIGVVPLAATLIWSISQRRKL